MQFPSLYQLRVAAQVLTIVGKETPRHSEVSESYPAIASGGLFTTSQFAAAEDWLVELGMLVREGETLRAVVGMELGEHAEVDVLRGILRFHILAHPPAWLGASFVDGVFRTELFPGQASDVLEEIFDQEEREALLTASMIKYDEARRQILGDLGERCVVGACRSFHCDRNRRDLADQVRRVSEISDAYGYDVESPNDKGEMSLLEVKCYSGPIPRVFITRHEYEVGVKQENWFLVVCQAVSDDEAEIIGWTDARALRWRVPREVESSAEWHVVRMQFETGQLNPGLPLEHG